MQSQKEYKYPKEVRDYFAKRNRKARAKKKKVGEAEPVKAPATPTRSPALTESSNNE
jgi:hypothetical protein